MTESDIVFKLASHFEQQIKETCIVQNITTIDAMQQILSRYDSIDTTINRTRVPPRELPVIREQRSYRENRMPPRYHEPYRPRFAPMNSRNNNVNRNRYNGGGDRYSRSNNNNSYRNNNSGNEYRREERHPETVVNGRYQPRRSPPYQERDQEPRRSYDDDRPGGRRNNEAQLNMIRLVDESLEEPSTQRSQSNPAEN